MTNAEAYEVLIGLPEHEQRARDVERLAAEIIEAARDRRLVGHRLRSDSDGVRSYEFTFMRERPKFQPSPAPSNRRTQGGAK